MLGAILAARAPVVAVSPVVGGRALRGPADRMLASLGGDASATGFVRHYRERYPGLVDVFVIDVVDAREAAALHARGLRVEARPTVMLTHADRQGLAASILAAHLPA
jgi:LPPG:FO 2-phospho-L-lactate transferase